MSTKNIGKVVQVIGPVLDIRFEDGHLPELLTAIEIMNGDKKVTAEVAQHVGDNVVRCISMNATDGMTRGLDAVDTGSPITVPVGEKCLGRIFNLLGDAIDNQPDPDAEERWAIHTTASIQGMPYYILQLFDTNIGPYYVTLTLGAFAEDTTPQLLELFYSLD